MRKTLSRLRLLPALLLLGLLLPTALAREPSKLPVLQAGDAAGLKDHFGQTALVEGRVKSAEWSDSGKVMNITFDAADSGLLAVVFERTGKRFDEAFAGDFSKAVTGRRVRVKGEIQPYGGYDERLKGRPQTILNSPEQVTILETDAAD